MKKLFIASIFALAGVSANAMVMDVSMGCSPLHVRGTTLPQANAPRLSLNCGIISSFGPTTMNCAANMEQIFPTVRQTTVQLQEVATTTSTHVYHAQDGMTVVVGEGGPDRFKAELSWSGLVSECIQQVQPVSPALPTP